MSLRRLIKNVSLLFLLHCAFASLAQARICLQGQATAGGTSSPTNSITFSKPSGSTTNDVLVVQVAANAQSGQAAFDTPSGWTRIREDTVGSLGQFIFYRTLTSSDASVTSYTFSIPSWASTARIGGGIVSLRGVNTGGVLENSYGNTSSPVLTTPSGTTAGNIWVIAAFASQNGNNVLTAGSGLVQANAINSGAGPNGISTVLAYTTQNAAGTVTAKTASGSTATSADALILIQADSSATSCTSTLVADYHLDESSWSSVSNEVIDSSGNNLHGTSIAGAQTRSATPALSGNPGTCNYGEFVTTNNQYVNIPHNTKHNFSSTFTAMAWIYISSYNTSGLRSFLSKDSNYEMHVASDGRLNWWMQGSAGTADYFSSITIPLNQWRHVAFRFELGQQDFFINGARDVAARKSYNGTLTLDTDPLQIGQDQNVSGRYWNGYIDEVRLYDGALSDAEILAASTERHTCPGIDHYQFEFSDNTGITCSPKTITIKACANSSCSTLASSSVSLTPSATNGGIWSSVGSFTGSTTATLRKTSAGTTTIGVSSATPSASGSPQCTIAGVSASCTINFVDSGFIWTFPSANVSSGINNIIANKMISGVTLKAVRTDNTTQSCAPAFVGARNVTLSSNYLNPTTINAPVYINGTSVAANPSMSLTFDSNASTSLSLQYADAGQLQLNAQYSGSAGTGDNGLSLSGSTTFISAPVGFCIQPLSSASPVTVVSSCNSSSCPFYRSAGTDFPMRTRAMAWEVDGESAENYCTGNLETHNYIGSLALTSSALDSLPSNGSLAQSNIAIADADDGIKITTNQQISEVGRFTLQYNAASYFGISIPSGWTTSFGRFAPANYAIAINNYSALTPCNGFAYAGTNNKTGQAINFNGQITAQNAQNNTTSNYTGAYALLNGSSMSLSDLVSGTASSNGDFSAAHTLSFTNGVASFNPSSTTYVFSGNYAPQLVQMRASASDSDGIIGSATTANSIDFRLGRMRLDNAYGPELLPLIVPLRAEYFDGTRYAINSLDSCSSYIRTSGTLSAFNSNLNSGETTITAPSSATLLSNGNYNNGAPLQLSAPGAGNDGNTTITLTVPSWLQFDWNNNGSNQNPTAIATFGRYRGSDRIIYWKEKR